MNSAVTWTEKQVRGQLEPARFPFMLVVPLARVPSGGGGWGGGSTAAPSTLQELDGHCLLNSPRSPKRQEISFLFCTWEHSGKDTDETGELLRSKWWQSQHSSYHVMMPPCSRKFFFSNRWAYEHVHKWPSLWYCYKRVTTKSPVSR